MIFNDHRKISVNVLSDAIRLQPLEMSPFSTSLKPTCLKSLIRTWIEKFFFDVINMFLIFLYNSTRIRPSCESIDSKKNARKL